MPREEIFLTSKLWNTHHPNVKEGLQKTLDALGVDYLDLYVSLRCAIVADVAAAKDFSKDWTDNMPISLSTGPSDSYRLVQHPTPYASIYQNTWLKLLAQNETSELLPVNPDGTRSVDRSWDQSETWRQMEEVYKSGKVKAIGVANWSIPYLEELRKTWTVVPAVNQVELHPFLPQHRLKEYCDGLGILLEAYSPLGSTGELLSHTRIQFLDQPRDLKLT